MRYILQLAMATILALTACSFGTKTTENNSDGDKKKTEKKRDYARAHGLYGNVKEVRLSVCKLTNVSPDEDPWVENDKVEMSFDNYGRVTIDEYDNTFKYGDDGKVTMQLRGWTDVNEVKFDSEGRMTSYLKQDSPNDREMESLSLTYDAQGRPLTKANNQWEATDQDSLVYEGDKPYPVKCINSGDYEADNYETVTTYKYTKFDEHGNWTERYSTTTGYTMIADDESTRENINEETLERRVISYYSDDEIKTK